MPLLESGAEPYYRAKSIRVAAMLSFQIPEMHCDGCVRSLTKAAQTLDPNATLTADMDTHRVTVKTSAPGAAVAEAFQDAGFDVIEALL